MFCYTVPAQVVIIDRKFAELVFLECGNAKHQTALWFSHLASAINRIQRRFYNLNACFYYNLNSTFYGGKLQITYVVRDYQIQFGRQYAFNNNYLFWYYVDLVGFHTRLACRDSSGWRSPCGVLSSCIVTPKEDTAPLSTSGPVF